jgi:hypothetical protein
LQERRGLLIVVLFEPINHGEAHPNVCVPGETMKTCGWKKLLMVVLPSMQGGNTDGWLGVCQSVQRTMSVKPLCTQACGIPSCAHNGATQNRKTVKPVDLQVIHLWSQPGSNR